MVQFGNLFGYMINISRFISFASMRHRSHKRGIGFKKKIFRIYPADNLSKVVRFGKSNIPGKGNVMMHFNQFAGIFQGAGKTMELRPYFPFIPPHYFHYVLIRFPVVNYEGEVKFYCQINLLLKSFNLHFFRREIIKIIESGFTDGNNFFICGKFFKALKDGFIPVFRVVRMNTYGSINKVIFTG